MLTRTLAAVGLALSSILCAATAGAAEPAPADPPGFLKPGSVVLDDLVGYRFGFDTATIGGQLGGTPYGLLGFYDQTTTSDANPALGVPPTFQKQSVFFFNPSVDVVVGRHLTLGGTLSLSNVHTRIGGADTGGGEYNQFGVGAAPRIGYLVRLSDDLAVWPRLSAGLRYGQEGSGLSNALEWNVTADLPLVVGVGRHFVLMVGPVLAYSNADQSTPASMPSSPISATAVRAGVFGSVGLVL